MDIIWHGRSCFTLKGKKVTIVTDPLAGTGFSVSKLKGDAVFISTMDDVDVLPVEGAKATFNMPGEYEVSGVPAIGMQAWDKSKSQEKEGEAPKKTVIFTFKIDDIMVGHLGNIGHTLTDEMIEKIGDIDVLLVPIGGKGCIDAKKAHEIIEEIEPRVVIPMNYKVNGEKIAYDGIEGFIKIAGTKPQELEQFSTQSKAQLPQDHTEYVVLAPRG